MKKVLFIDRDGTLIKEPSDEQVDSYEKLEFYPKMISNLSKITKELNFELVMITNQDGLGTEAFPSETFWPVHNFMVKTLENEGIYFSEQFIDSSFPEENSPNRKPGTGLLTKYFSADYDLEKSLVIGDRLTDVELAKNLGSKAIYLNSHNYLGTDEVKSMPESLNEVICLETNDWDKIYQFLKLEARMVKVRRKTNETDINLILNLDGTGITKIKTGLPFFDHMLDQIGKHGNMDIDLVVNGDLEVD